MGEAFPDGCAFPESAPAKPPRDLRGYRRRFCRGLLGEPEVERASLYLPAALDPDAPAVGLDDELAEGESEPGAPHARNVRRLHLLELAEDDVVVLGRDADTVVRHGEQHTVILAARAE